MKIQEVFPKLTDDKIQELKSELPYFLKKFKDKFTEDELLLICLGSKWGKFDKVSYLKFLRREKNLDLNYIFGPKED